jgi:uncharacterized protein YfbU (UPF0304 family)
MATITIRVDDSVRDGIEEYASAHRMSVSEALRSAIEALLGLEVGMSRSDVPTTLNMVDRKTLSLLHQILDKLDDGSDHSEDYFANMSRVLDSGYTGEYDAVFTETYDELSRVECELLWDILDMFRILKSSRERLAKKETTSTLDENTWALEFGGFDANDHLEGKLLGYARYTMDTGRWTDLTEYFDDAHERGNSHSPRLDMYRRMLAVYKPIFTTRIRNRGVGEMHLSADELRQVADAALYPRN